MGIEQISAAGHDLMGFRYGSSDGAIIFAPEESPLVDQFARHGMPAENAGCELRHCTDAAAAEEMGCPFPGAVRIKDNDIAGSRGLGSEDDIRRFWLGNY